MALHQQQSTHHMRRWSYVAIGFFLLGLSIWPATSVAQLGLPLPLLGGLPVEVVIGLPLPPAAGGAFSNSLPGTSPLPPVSPPGTPPILPPSGTSPISAIPWLLGLNTAQGLAPLPVRFGVQGPPGAPFVLDFGDGKSITGLTSLVTTLLEHIFDRPGEFNVTLKVGGLLLASTKIKVLASLSSSPSNKATLGLAANLTVGTAPLNVNFNVLGQVGTNFVLDFGDGKIFVGVMAAASVTVGHVFSNVGDFTVVLKVGGQVTAIINVKVLTPPTAPSTNATSWLTADITAGPAPLAVNFSIQGPMGASFALEFGDGKLFVGKVMPGLKVSHVFFQAGEFTTVLQISGQPMSSTKIAVLASRAEISFSANFGISASVTTGLAPLTVNFSIQGPTGAPFICDFGDGTIFLGIVTPGLTILHVFVVPGVFPVSLMSGGQKVASIKITVQASQAQVPFRLIPDETVGVAPLTVNFEIQGPVGASFVLDFGDGKLFVGKVTLGLKVSHVFLQAGEFTVILQVGGQATASIKITVQASQAQVPFRLIPDETVGVAPLTVDFAIQGPRGSSSVCDFGYGKSDSDKIMLGLASLNIFANVSDFNVDLLQGGILDVA